MVRIVFCQLYKSWSLTGPVWGKEIWILRGSSRAYPRYHLKPLIEINEDTKQYARVVCTVLAAAAWDVFFEKRRRARGRTILFLGKQYCHTYQIQEREFSFNEGKFFLYRTPARSSVRNGF
jgi:hypothetical protein